MGPSAGVTVVSAGGYRCYKKPSPYWRAGQKSVAVQSIAKISCVPFLVCDRKAPPLVQKIACGARQQFPRGCGHFLRICLLVPQQVQNVGPSRRVGLPLHVDTRTSTLGEIARSRELDRTRMVEADELTELVTLRDWLRYAVTRFNAVATFGGPS